jgi:serine phosphatase RsbU (regulator of sigma subunit)
MRILGFCFALLLVFNAPAQKMQDSLREVINSAKNDSVKIIAYTNLSNSVLDQPQRALEILSEMKVYCETIKDEKFKALCLRKIGALYSFLNNFDRALEYTYKAANLFEKTKQIDGLAYCYNNIGNFYNYKGEFTKDIKFQERSIEYHLKSIALRDTLKDSIPLMNSYNNIGNSTMAFGNYNLALKYFNKSRSMFLVTGNVEKIQMINENLGTCYLRLADKEQDKKYLKQALFYFTSILKNYNGSNPSNTFANVLVNVGFIYSEQGNSSLGISYAQKGLDMAKQLHDKRTIMEIEKRFSNIYEKAGDHKKALEHIHSYNSNKDSLINERNSSSIEEMQAQYKSSQKDKEIDKLNNDKILKDAELSRQRTIILASVVAVASIFILVLVLLNRNNLKKKANLKLSEAYKKIEIKNQQITDSINYSKRIQNAILPPTELVDKSLKNFFVYYKPKDIVSGDFYWFSDHNNQLFFIVVDCTGHGVPGALMSMIGNTLLNEIINQKSISEPGEILNHLNKGVKHALRQSGSDNVSQDDGMDVSICCIDKNDKKVLRYASANHSIFVKSKGKVDELFGDIYSIGGDFGNLEKKFETKTHLLEADSFIVMSSDGYYDQFGGPSDSKFLISRFEKLILDTDLTQDNVAESFNKALLDWKGSQKQTDDILVAGFKV